MAEKSYTYETTGVSIADAEQMVLAYITEHVPTAGQA